MPMYEPHFRFLDWMIGNYVEFRDYICYANRLEMKRRFAELMNLEYLNVLEVQHPDVLSIGDKTYFKINVGVSDLKIFHFHDRENIIPKVFHNGDL